MTHQANETKAPDANHTVPGNTRGATLVVTHRVRDGSEKEYERWMGVIEPLCRSSPGNLDWQIIEPIPGLSSTYTVVIRFDSEAHLQQWVHSSLRGELIERVRPLLAGGDDIFIRSGLDFWFAPLEARNNVPARWRQSLVTWSVIYPLVLGVPMIVSPALRLLGMPDHRLLTTFVATVAIVMLMVYIIMPRYTKLVRRWLYA